MATFKSDLLIKRINHRGLYDGKTQVVSGAFRLKPGVTLTASDLLQMFPLGENVIPTKVILSWKKVSGTPVLTGGTFSVGVAPVKSADFIRPTGQVFPALTANATALVTPIGTAATVGSYTKEITAKPSANTKYGPFYATLTPTASTSVAGGELDLYLHVEYDGEHNEADPVYTSFKA